MSRRRSQVDRIVNLITETMNDEAKRRLARHRPEDVGAWNLVLSQVQQEHADGRLRKRVHHYVTRHPVMATEPIEIRNAIHHDMGEEMVEAQFGNGHIPKGIQEGDCWLAPAAPMQRMLMERTDEDAVLMIVAKRGPDGKLGPAYCWTTTDELIADAQKGHRRYMELLAAEQQT
jgi:hypothetical protein